MLDNSRKKEVAVLFKMLASYFITEMGAFQSNRSSYFNLNGEKELDLKRVCSRNCSSL